MMNIVNIVGLFVLGLAMPLVAIASPDDDVTIRVMEMNEHAADAVTRHIELPDVASDRGKEQSEHGLNTANTARSKEHEKEREYENEAEHENEMENEKEVEREIEIEMENEKEVEREIENEVEREIEHENSSEHSDKQNEHAK